jgi:hypothetical protein
MGVRGIHAPPTHILEQKRREAASYGFLCSSASFTFLRGRTAMAINDVPAGAEFEHRQVLTIRI